MSEENKVNENIEKEVTQEQPSELEQKVQELDELTDRYKRVMAEFENYKKRAQKDRETLYGRTLSDVIEIMLPVLDNLENAAKAETQDASYKKGVEMVLKQFKDTLATRGVEEIKALGETFDPEVHEAVMSVQDESKGDKEIVEVFRTGYRLKDKVVRHSLVKVAN